MPVPTLKARNAELNEELEKTKDLLNQASVTVIEKDDQIARLVEGNQAFQGRVRELEGVIEIHLSRIRRANDENNNLFLDTKRVEGQLRQANSVIKDHDRQLKESIEALNASADAQLRLEGQVEALERTIEKLLDRVF